MIGSENDQDLLAFIRQDDGGRIALGRFFWRVEIAVDFPGDVSGGLVQGNDVRTACLHDGHNAIVFGQNRGCSQVPPQGVLAELLLQVDRPKFFSTEIYGGQITTLEVGKDRFSVCNTG